MTTFKSLCSILVKNYQAEPDRLHPDTPLDSLALDSLGLIELVFSIEDTFKIRVPDADAQSAGSFGTLGDLAAYIDRLVATDASAVAGDAPARHSEIKATTT